MSELCINYRGYEIKWNGNSEEWYCYEIAGKDYSNPRPSKIKAAIDKMYLDRRKKSSIPVLEITWGGSDSKSDLLDAVVTEYVSTGSENSYPKGNRGNSVRVVTHKVAVVASRGPNEKATRKEKLISELALDTPEVRDAYAHYLELYNLSRDYLKQATAAREAIPRLTFEDVKKLYDLAESMREEGAV